MLQSVESYSNYLESIRRRTLNYVRAVPADKMEWSPKAGEFTCGEIIRHIGATEKMYVNVFANGVWHYDEHDHEQAGSLDEVIADLELIHVEALKTLRAVSDSELLQPRPTVEGGPIKAWRLLMMLVEHEVHHRSQLAVYLALMGVQPPQIYGMKLEDVIARLTS
jgi:uncharacterized damage-inducible protein DinB